jgi:predicted acylesterase/phospholipase RssA
MAALDRLDELEQFLLELQPADVFRPQRLWRLPLNGLHEYALPATISERLLDVHDLACRLNEAPVEVVIFATDVSDDEECAGSSFELAYSSHETPPETLAQAVLASAAISALVLPLTVGDRIATDGGWVRNFPLGNALDHPEVELVVCFRYVPRYPRIGGASLSRMRARLHRFRAVPPVRAFIAELDEAEARQLRGEPMHLGDMVVRLMRVAIQRNTSLEERLANERDEAIRELEALRADVARIVAEHARPGRRGRAARAVEERFGQTKLPRSVGRITVRGTSGAESLDPGLRSQREWSEQAKRALIDRGYAAADAELAAHGVDREEQAS